MDDRDLVVERCWVTQVFVTDDDNDADVRAFGPCKSDGLVDEWDSVGTRYASGGNDDRHRCSGSGGRKTKGVNTVAGSQQCSVERRPCPCIDRRLRSRIHGFSRPPNERCRDMEHGGTMSMEL